jgi:hypothetical protein
VQAELQERRKQKDRLDEEQRKARKHQTKVEEKGLTPSVQVDTGSTAAIDRNYERFIREKLNQLLNEKIGIFE